MPLHLRPVGPLPETVYWRRRAVVVIGLVLLLFLLSRCVGGGGDDGTLSQAASSPGPSPTVAPTPQVSPSATPSPTSTTVACTDADLRVEAVAERASYAVGARPVLRLAIRSTSLAPCSRALGQGAVELSVFSGADRIWSSDDCAPGGPEGVETLQPQQLKAIVLTWAGRRSSPGCASPGPAITAGSYRVVGRVGELRTPGSSFVVR
jgi:hypothetical protein